MVPEQVAKLAKAARISDTHHRVVPSPRRCGFGNLPFFAHLQIVVGLVSRAAASILHEMKPESGRVSKLSAFRFAMLFPSLEKQPSAQDGLAVQDA